MKWIQQHKTEIGIAAVLLLLIIIWFIIRKMNMRKAEDLANNNVQAFLKLIQFSEGTLGPNAYRMMFTGKLFDNGFADHPREVQTANGISSDAAGAYQFLSTTWDEIKDRLSLPDFTPANQDLACAQRITDRGAWDNVVAGNFAQAVQQLNTTWASLPGSPYGQPTKQLSDLQNFYTQNGGTINQA